MTRDSTPPLWSWEVVRDVPATEDRPRFIEEVAYVEGRAVAMSRYYVLVPGSKHMQEHGRWKTENYRLDEPSHWLLPVIAAITVAFWFFFYNIMEA